MIPGLEAWDETFFRVCLEELRDGEVVTVRGPLAKRAEAWMRRHGATQAELDRLVLVEGSPWEVS